MLIGQNAAVAVQAAIQEMGWRGRVHKNTVRMWCIIIGAIFALLSYMLLHSLKGWLDRVAGDYASFLMFVAPSLFMSYGIAMASVTLNHWFPQLWQLDRPPTWSRAQLRAWRRFLWVLTGAAAAGLLGSVSYLVMVRCMPQTQDKPVPFGFGFLLLFAAMWANLLPSWLVQWKEEARVAVHAAVGEHLHQQ